MTEQCWLLLLLSRIPSPFNFQALFSFAGYWLGVQSSCLSFLEFPAPTPFFLASFSNAYFLPISPASHPFRTPTSRFFPAPIPIPLLPLLSWAPPPYSPTMGASCRHSYYLLILIVAKFLPSPLNLSATQLLQGLTVLAVKTIDIEIQQWLYPQNNGAACYGEPMKLEVLRAAY